MTIVLPMTLDGGYETDPSRLKVPDELAGLFAGEVLTEATGAAIAKWVGGEPIDHGLELVRRRAFESAGAGTVAFIKWWHSAAVRPHRKKLGRDFDNLASIARAADADAERERDAQQAAGRRRADEVLLDNPFGGRAPLGQPKLAREAARAA